MHNHGTSLRPMFVHLSVMTVYCIETENLSSNFTRPGSPVILDFFSLCNVTQVEIKRSQREALNKRGLRKILSFLRPIFPCILRVQDRPMLLWNVNAGLFVVLNFLKF